MAGYVCKIVIENTHPPVWRRVVIPERITFAEMHEIIQVIFGWEDEHLHDFSIPADHIRIDDGKESSEEDYNEKDTLVDSFFNNYKWIRYTYDFGDDWRHKINIEKIDDAYDKRYATLLKFKGNNFMEDSGGVWYGENHKTEEYNADYVNKQLEKMLFPKHEELQEEVLLKDKLRTIQEAIDKISKMKTEIVQSLTAEFMEELSGKESEMKQRIQTWFDLERKYQTVTILPLSSKTQQELMMALGQKESTDYYKYLRLPQDELLPKQKKIEAISQTFLEHQDYFFYIFDEKQYKELEKWIAYPQNQTIKEYNGGVFLKAVGMGLADVVDKGNTVGISFASDVSRFVGNADSKMRANVYNNLTKFDERLGSLIKVYGIIELESLYEMYKHLYQNNQDKEKFLRYVYWHARFNAFVRTMYLLDGTCYVAQSDLEAESVIEKIQEYSDNMTYASYSRREIANMAEDLANCSDWVDILFSSMVYYMHWSEEEAQDWLYFIVECIFNGYAINTIMDSLYEEGVMPHNLEAETEIWCDIWGLMQEFKLPMLKGRSREQYAKETGKAAWNIDMVSDDIKNINNTKPRHIYEFPDEIQGLLYMADAQSSGKALQELYDYKKEHGICSEEFIYLLAEMYMKNGDEDTASRLIAELKRSSAHAKKEAEKLENIYRTPAVQDNMDWGWSYPEEIIQPYVRKEPKIGRNDPCPCGSGIKYKKCCGK